uniref:ATP synthase subunit a n=1 Tax=Magadhaideus sp. n. SX-2018 TaxID=2220057 RepID=A0A3S5XHP9_9HEMI|nr:ATP synthase F0 subunit 6 [Magadhaideus sp. n. SX-2018]
MMTSLFSPFDPTSMKFQMNWMSMLIVMIIMPKNFWLKESRITMIEKNIIEKIYKEFFNITHHKEIILISMSLFLMIALNNLMGLFPYIFTATSHISTSMAMALPLWTMLMIYGWINHTNSMFMHLLPTGTPYLIMPMMILIETTGNIIRPISLSVRLTANMIAGHLLMTLLGNLSDTNSVILTFPLKMILMTFESAISMIQAYVFSTLITLYSSEIP